MADTAVKDTVVKDAAPGKLGVFMIVWLGQLISYTGSGLTSFALIVWTYETTGSITQMALLSAFTVLPTVVLSPMAGAYVDRWDRRRAMILSDAGAGLSTVAIALLLATGHLQIWHVYVAASVSAVFGALRWPALSASTTQLVPKKQFGRASGLLQIVQAGQVLISPALAGVLMTRIHLLGIVLIDVVTFVFAVATLLAVQIPKPEQTAEGQARRGSILRETIYGWTYIRVRAGLLALLIYGFTVSLFIDMGSLLLVPLILQRASSAALGTALSIGGIGFLVGGATMSAWGGPKRPIDGVFGFPLLAGLCLALMGFQSTVFGITACLFAVLICLPLFYACNQTIWQRKVAPDIQGRVFAIRRTIIMSSRLVASLAAGPVADHLFKPLFGSDHGISVLYITLGLLVLSISTGASMYPRLRLIDSELVDAVSEPTAQQAHAY